MRKLLLLSACFSLLALSAFAQPNNYRSRVSGNWSSASTWENDTAGNGSFSNSVSAPTISDGTITIRNTHTVLVTTGISIDQTTVQSGGLLQVDIGITLTIADGAGNDLEINSGSNFQLLDDADFDGALLVVQGYLNNSGTIIFDSGLSSISFQSASTYEHSQNGGTIPSATWNSNSLCYVTGITNVNPAGGNQNFGKFTWECSGHSGTRSLGMSGSRTFAGNFSILNTGSGAMAFTSTNSTAITIAGNFTISGSSSAFTIVGSQSATLTVNGNYDNSSTSTTASRLATTGTGTLVAKGNFTQSAGTLQGNSTSVINFSKAGTQNFTSGGTFTTVNFDVKNGSKLNLFGNNAVSGDGTFTVENGGTILVGSKHGSGAIQSGTSAGNVQVSGTRTYASGSTVIYDGNAVNGNSSGSQTIGDGQPTGTGVITRIDNPSGVALSNDLIIVGTLIQDAGDLSVGSTTLTLNGIYTSNGNALNVTTASNLAIGGTGDFGTLNLSGSTTINSLVLTRSSTGIVTLGSNLTIGTSGNFSMDFTNLILNGKTLTVKSDFAQTNGATITADAAASFIIDGAGTLPSPISLSGSAINTIEDIRSGTANLSATITVTNLKLTGGTLNISSGGITMGSGGLITRTNGIYTGATISGTPYSVTYSNASGIATGVELPTSPTAVVNFTKNGSGLLTLSNNLTVNTLLTLNGGFDSNGKTIDLKGNAAFGAVPTLSASTFIVSGSSSGLTGLSPTFGNLTITGTFSPSIDYQVNGALDASSGTLNNGSVTTTFGGSPSTISGTPTFNNLTVASSSTLTGPSTLNVNGTFRNDGTYNAGSGTINVGGNWTNNSSGGFVAGTSTVVFNGTTTIGGTQSTSFNNITISGTGNVTPPSVLTVGGNFAINGTFTSGTGRVTFNGTSNQSLDRTAGSGTTIDLFDIRVDKTSGAFNVNSTVSSTIFRVLNEFTIAQNGSSNPDVDFDGTGSGVMVFRSTSSRTAKLTAVPAGVVVSGNLTVERFIQNTAGVRAYRYLTTPVSGTTVADWQNEIEITGAFSNPSSGGGIPDPNAASMYEWIETNGGVASNRYVAYPNNISNPASSFPLINGTGYAVFIRNTGTPTIDVRGVIAVGDFPINLRRTGAEANAAGYNLIGNPYAAPINWDAVTIPGPVDLGISMLDNVSNAGLGGGQFVYYVKNGPDVGGFTGVIGSGQGFWTSTSTDNTVLTFQEANKASDTNPIILRTNSLANILRIKIEGNGRKDETVIYAVDGSTDGFDGRFDARKRPNTYINLYSYFDQGGATFAINGINSLGCSKNINLGLTQVNSAGALIQVPVGTYKFNFSQLETFIGDYSFSLVDSFTGTTVNMKTQPEYQFQVSTEVSSYGENRFKVVITSHPVEVTVVDTKLVSSSSTGNQWFFNGQVIPGATGQTYEPTKTGTYKVEVTNAGCVASAERQFVITGLEDRLPSHISVSPNPTRNIISVAVNSTNEVHARLITLLGIPLGEKELEGTTVKRGTFNLEDQSDGMYILIVQDGTEVYQTRIIKKR